MQLKNLSRSTLLVAIFVGLIIFLFLIFYFIPESPIQNSLALLSEKINIPLIESSASPAGQPMRLKIPSINVDATVEYVGLAFDGSMDIPKNSDNVAWFKFGPRPGEIGSAVMAGHFDRANGAPAVFNSLSKLREGDRLYVEDEKGIVTVFVARESRNYDSNANTSGIFGSNDSQAHLNLITCEGVWNKTAKSYSRRLVVFADKE